MSWFKEHTSEMDEVDDMGTEASSSQAAHKDTNERFEEEADEEFFYVYINLYFCIAKKHNYSLSLLCCAFSYFYRLCSKQLFFIYLLHLLCTP